MSDPRNFPKDWLTKDTLMNVNVFDPVENPIHYTEGNIECIDAIEEAVKDLQGIEAVCTANALKYIWRWKKKNGTEDLRKSVWYLNRLIQILEKK